MDAVTDLLQMGCHAFEADCERQTWLERGSWTAGQGRTSAEVSLAQESCLAEK